MSTIQVTDLRLEHHRPTDRLLAVETATPRLSWCVVGAPAGWEQSGYEVEVSRGAAGTGTAQPTAVQTLTVDSCEQVLVPWPTAPLASRESATLRVRLRGTDGALTGWSRPVEVEAALLDPSEWQADFIAPVGIGEPGGRAPVISRTLEVPNGTVRARLRATGHGLIEPRVNGTRVDDSVLNPGWTSYAHRLQVVTWDVTDLLTPGTHTLDVLLGNGWWRGHVGYFGMTQRFGTRLALAAQLELTGPDGALTVIATADDGTWTAHESAVTADDLYDGQSTDLRLAPDLTGPADDGASTHPVEVVPAATREDESATIALVPQSAPLVRPTGLLPARRVWTSPSGRTLVDFGQNAVGVVRLTVRGLEAGTEVTLRHAEVLEDGELATRPLRAARATDTWVLDGPAERVLEPTLTLHGLRYAEVTGVPHLAPEDVSLVVIGSDMQPTGSFTCSDDLLNRLHANTVWSTRGNFVSIPTDCPQRDERLGWTGDIQAFAPTASFLFDTISFLASWLTDLRAEQHENGSVPHVVPMFMPSSTQEPSAAAWGDAATTVPVDLYEASGDLEVLRAQLPSMTAWVEREAALAGEDLVWSGGFQFGDWLDPTAPPER
ncbi:family 78 glycoside hydrolase catalytic domain, partial [Actinomyces sp. 187325]